MREIHPFLHAARSVVLTSFATIAIAAFGYAIGGLIEGWTQASYMALAAFANLVAPVLAITTAFHLLSRRRPLVVQLAMSVVLCAGTLIAVFLVDAFVINTHVTTARLLRTDYLGWLPALGVVALITPLLHRRINRRRGRQRVLQDLFAD